MRVTRGKPLRNILQVPDAASHGCPVSNSKKQRRLSESVGYGDKRGNAMRGPRIEKDNRFSSGVCIQPGFQPPVVPNLRSQ